MGACTYDNLYTFDDDPLTAQFASTVDGAPVNAWQNDDVGTCGFNLQELAQVYDDDIPWHLMDNGLDDVQNIDFPCTPRLGGSLTKNACSGEGFNPLINNLELERGCGAFEDVFVEVRDRGGNMLLVEIEELPAMNQITVSALIAAENPTCGCTDNPDACQDDLDSDGQVEYADYNLLTNDDCLDGRPLSTQILGTLSCECLDGNCPGEFNS